MKFMNFKIAFTFVVFIMAIAACNGGSSDSDSTPEADTFNAPAVPQYSLAVQETSESVVGVQRVVCWTRGVANTSCDLNSAAPDNPLNVPLNSTVKVESNGTLLPSAIQISSPSNPNLNIALAADNTFSFDFSNVPEGNILELEITAYYSDVAGSPGTVTSAFVLQVGPPAVALATPAPTEEPSPLATAIPTETVEPMETMVPTDVPTEAVTAIATEIPTEEITPFVAETPTEIVTEVVETETPETPQTTPDITETVEIVATPTDTVETLPTVTPTSQLPSPTATTLIPTSTLTETSSIITPTNTQGAIVQPSPTFTPFAPPPSPTQTPRISTPVPFPTVTATLPPIIQRPSEPPTLTLNFDNIDFTPAGLEFCETLPTNEVLCLRRPAGQNVQRVALANGSTITINISGDIRPTLLEVNLQDFNSRAEVFKETRSPDQDYAFTLTTPNSGVYFLNVEVAYEETNITATYFFLVQIR